MCCLCLVQNVQCMEVGSNQFCNGQVITTKVGNMIAVGTVGKIYHYKYDTNKVIKCLSGEGSDDSELTEAKVAGCIAEENV